ncbi:MAG: aminotransferase class V-fold PLP-dependent enzyme [Phycisphaerae bacterium]|jgi:cysteine desulfurase family protein|nr:aminotransferase class V-fold PLP-dependent enzyme [Phycisphaerae bacterium]
MQNIVYLDNAATSFPKPDQVLTAARDFYAAFGVNPGRTGCDLCLAAEQMILQTRKRLSAFFNPSAVAAGKPKDPKRLIFTLNGTMSLNLIVNGMVGPGDHVVTTMVEHNSVIRPVNHRVRDAGATATYVVPDGEGYIDPEDIRKAIRPNTKLVIVNHASNVTGVVQDVQAIGKVCRELGVPLAVDTAQTAGVLPIDMTECNISFLAFTGHKGLLAPTGTGGICVADDAEIRGTIYGGTGVRSADPYHLEEYPYRLEAGTQNLAGIAGLSAGLDWLEEHGMDKVRRHEMELMAELQNGLAEIPGVKIWGTKRLDRRVATLSITVANYDPSDVGTILDAEHTVLVRTGLHCAPLIHDHMGSSPRGTVRFSIGPYNTREHVAAAIRAVEQLASDRPATTQVQGCKL